ncbi:MAG: TonB-dependent receptor [bacterium]|nr:TonB-dependent receptor [bacterium]
MWFIFILTFPLISSCVTGRIVDNSTGEFLEGVNIVLIGTPFGGASDTDGKYCIKNIPQGEYIIKASMIGYKTGREKITVLRNNDIVMDFKLELTPMKMQEVTVTAEHLPLSQKITELQIRQNPEHFDIQRVIASCPGVASMEDYSSRISVRGGSPDENLTIIDGFEFPYPTHFGWFGGEGGGITLINEDIVREIKFQPGGFPVNWGDKLSSLIEINLKESDNISSLLDFNLADVKLIFELPIKEKGSTLFSVRKSHLELLNGILQEKISIPSYQDYLGKISFDINKNNKFLILGVKATDNLSFGGDYGPFENIEIKWNNSQNTLGVAWQHLFSENGKFTANATGNAIVWDAYQKGRGKMNASEISLPVSFDLNYKGFESGISYKYLDLYHYFNQFPDTTPTSIPLPGDTIESKAFSYKYASYIRNRFSFSSFSVIPGIRMDYFDLIKKSVVSPRLTVEDKLSSAVILACTIGKYYQSPRYDYLAQNNNLNSEEATHYIVGLKYLLSETSLLSIEAYAKKYENLFVSTSDSTGIDNSGKGYAKGIECLLDKEFFNNLSCMVNYSYSVSKVSDRNGEHYSNWDQTNTINIIGNYKFSGSFDFSIKWRYTTGKPYTPFLGRQQHPVLGKWMPIFGECNSARYPDYQRLDTKLTYSKKLKNFDVSIYLNLWNVYNYENILTYEWDSDYKNRSEIYQFLFTPILGLEIKF